MATVTFRVLRAGDAGIRLARVRARDAANHPLDAGLVQLASQVAPPAQTVLLAPAPNPFTSRATLDFGLARAGQVELAVYAVDGRRVRTLVHGVREAGVYRVTWDGADERDRAVAPGVFYVQLPRPDVRSPGDSYSSGRRERACHGPVLDPGGADGADPGGAGAGRAARRPRGRERRGPAGHADRHAGGDVRRDARRDAAGSAFNGFDAVVSYDSTALTFVPLALPLQQGCLMTGGCSAACGNTFHVFTSAADSLSITVGLLCDQITLTGPGTVYKLRFTASDSVQVTHVRLRSAAFYDAGVYVQPVNTADATIGIGVSLAAPMPGRSPAGLRLSAPPNPARGAVALAIESDAAGEQSLDVYDVTGRWVRHVDGGWQPGGARSARWDGRDAHGDPVRSGIYLVTVRLGDRAARARVVVLE